MSKKLISCILASAILLSSLDTINVYANTPQDTIKQNLSKYTQLNSEILGLNSKIDELNIEIEKINSKLVENNEAITSIENQITSTESKLEQTKEDIEKAQSALDNRIRNMYKTNITSNIIASVINSTSISDLFSRLQAIYKIISTDKKILTTINEKKDSLD